MFRSFNILKKLNMTIKQCDCKTDPEEDLLPFGFRFICPNCKRHPNMIQDKRDEAIKDWNFFIGVIKWEIECPIWMARRDYEEVERDKSCKINN